MGSRAEYSSLITDELNHGPITFHWWVGSRSDYSSLISNAVGSRADYSSLIIDAVGSRSDYSSHITGEWRVIEAWPAVRYRR